MLQVGDVLDVMTPTGRFFTELDPAHRKHYVCDRGRLAGSRRCCRSWRRTLEAEPASAVTLVYANRTHTTVMFLEEVEDLKDRYPDRFQLLHVLSREPQEVELFSGRLDADRLSADPRRRCCRPTPSTSGSCAGRSRWSSDLRKLLRRARACPRRRRPRRAVPRRVEAAAGPSYAGRDRGRRGRQRDDHPRRAHLDVHARAHRRAAVLDAALQVRADAPFACKGGVCGTCRAKVLEGAVAMDTNYALEPEEVEHGYVLTCQSHPTSDRSSSTTTPDGGRRECRNPHPLPVEEVAAYRRGPDERPRWYANIGRSSGRPRRRCGRVTVAFVARFLGAGSPTPTRSSSWCPASGW